MRRRHGRIRWVFSSVVNIMTMVIKISFVITTVIHGIIIINIIFPGSTVMRAGSLSGQLSLHLIF